jgi:phage terminase large subunit-like protein
LGFIEHKTCNVELVEADADKVTRAQLISGRAKAGLISVDRNAAWWHALRSEMSRFPRSSWLARQVSAFGLHHQRAYPVGGR